MQRRDVLRAGAAGLILGGCLAASAAAAGSDAEADVRAAQDWTAKRRFLQTRFGEIAYQDRGAGPAALFLHGFPLNSFQWRGAVDRLSSVRRCIAPDSLGLGFTRVAPGQAVTPAAQAQMLAALLDALRVPSVDIVANDSGGAVAQLFMTRHPERVRTALLTNCDVEPDSPPPALRPVIELAHAGTYPDKWLVPWLADKTLARSSQGLGGMCFTYPNHPTDAALDTYLGPLTDGPARKALTNAYTLGLEHNPLAGLEPQLRACRIPTRIVWGTGDTIFSPANPDYLDRLLPRSRGVRRVAGARLFFPEEFPDLVAEEARRLWAV
jgi:pimeloyl-ACP methyl ester carboxylesterase